MHIEESFLPCATIEMGIDYSLIFHGEVISMVHKKIMAALAAGFLCFSFSSYANEGPDAPKEEVLPFAAAVKSNGKWGAVDGSGQQVIPLSYDKVGISLSDPDVKDDDVDSEPGRENLVEVEEKGLRGFYNRQ